MEIKSVTSLLFDPKHTREVWDTVSKSHATLFKRQLKKIRQSRHNNESSNGNRTEDKTRHPSASPVEEVPPTKVTNMGRKYGCFDCWPIDDYSNNDQSSASLDETSTRKGVSREMSLNRTVPRWCSKSRPPTNKELELFLVELITTAKEGYDEHYSSTAQLTIAFVCAMGKRPEWKPFIEKLLSVNPAPKIDLKKYPRLSSTYDERDIASLSEVATASFNEESECLLKKTSATDEGGKLQSTPDASTKDDDEDELSSERNKRRNAYESATTSKIVVYGDKERSSKLTKRRNALLHEAAKTGNCKTLDVYLNRDNVNIENNFGETPLHFAARYGYSEDVKVLLVNGAEIKADTVGFTPLHAAAMAFKPNSKIAKLLVQAMHSGEVGINYKSKKAHTEEKTETTPKNDENRYRSFVCFCCKGESTNRTSKSSSKDKKEKNMEGENGDNTALHVDAACVNNSNKKGNTEEKTETETTAAKNEGSSDKNRCNCILGLCCRGKSKVSNSKSTRKSSSKSNKEKNMAGEKENNTALHIAAGNANVTEAFISQFRNANSKLRNFAGDTPFHVAAESTNPKAIIYMLNTFGGWDIDEVDAGPKEQEKKTGRKEQKKELLIDICATAGNAEAVALLIQHGADIKKGVLHKIVTESVRRPEKTAKLIAVYHAIVDNAVTWADMEVNAKDAAKSTDEYNSRLRETMMKLITSPLPDCSDDVLNHAIKCGASEMFLAILNTEHVFREDRDQRNACYDVTNFLMATRVKPKTENYSTGQANSGNPASEEKKRYDPYVRTVLRYYKEWLDKDVLQKQPIKKLFDPYISFIQGFYLVLALVQLLFMILFGIVYLPTTCSLSEMFRINITESHSCRTYSNTTRYSPSKLWLVWPSVLLVGSIINALWAVFVLCDNKRNTNDDIADRKSIKVKSPRNIWSEWFGAVAFYLWHGVPFTAFYISVFCWYAEYTNSERHDRYLSVTSMVFLFGWLTTLLFVTGVTKEFFVFSLLLKEIVLKDLITSFLAVFAFALVGFSFALHTLRLTVLPPGRQATFQATFFDAFGAAFGIGDFMENTREEFTSAGVQLTLFESVFISYVCFTTIILLNVLIAMLNNRFKISKRRAENLFRFHILRTAVELERFRGFRNRYIKENHAKRGSKMYTFISYLMQNEILCNLQIRATDIGCQLS